MPKLGKSVSKAIPKVFKKLGENVIIRTISLSSYNTTSGTVTETTTDKTVKGVVSDVSRSEVNDLVNQGDKRLLVAANDLSAVPTTKDKVLINNSIHQIINVETETATGNDITYKLILRN